jgi:hypothetical protein
MQQQQLNNNEIHCKVQYGNEFRRFVYDNSEFASFQQQITELFGFKNSEEVILKYKDDEGDMVTISSDEELEFAIDVFAGSILRLTVCTAPKDEVATPQVCPQRPMRFHHGARWGQCPEPPFGGFRPKHCERGGRKGPKGHCRQGPKQHCGKEGRGAEWREKWINKMQANPELLSRKIEMLTKKRDLLKTRLDWIQNKDSSCPRRDHRKMHLECKLKKVESWLAHLQSIPNLTTNINAPVKPIVINNQVPIEEKPETKESLKEALVRAREQREVMAKALAEEHKEMMAVKSEIQAIRSQGRAPENLARIVPLKETLDNFRAIHQQKKSELQVHDATMRNLRSKLQNLKKENL